MESAGTGAGGEGANNQGFLTHTLGKPSLEP